MKRRTFLQAAGVASVLPRAVMAQDKYPSKLITWICPYAAGGNADIRSRQLSAAMAKLMNVVIIVDNKPGAGGNIGTEAIVRAKPDGYTLGLGNFAPMAVNKSLFKKINFDPLTDLTPIMLIEKGPLILMVRADSPHKTVKDLVAAAKKTPGKTTYASGGIGGTHHMSAALFSATAGIDMIHVPYKGSSQAVQALLAGEVAVTFSTMPPALTSVKAGRLRALGVTTPQRNSAAPEVPTIAEAGLKGFDVVLYSGVLAPARLPAPIVTKLNAEFIKAVNSPEVKTVYASLGVDAITDTPAEFAAHIAADIDKLGKAVRASGAHAD